ncbi:MULTISPECIES: hypothetical protein [unclassified Pseudomonas]|uniref:hypothetical protein n=1 Tax=unclassified Pseudomonas TaxID=196821 RepID=UPI0035C1C492
MIRIQLCVISLALLAGCASQSSTAPYASAKPGCQSENRQVNGQSVKTDFCIRSIPFKPSQYLVKVNGENAFKGDDFKRVAFQKKLSAGMVSGGCNELIELQSSASEENVELDKLSPELIQGCAIKADAKGNASAFEKTEACDKVFYKGLTPLLGKVMPVETARQCSVTLNGQQVFSGRFVFD